MPPGKSKPPSKRKLPAALVVANALEKSKSLAARLVQVRADVALVKRRLSEISDAFYDIGLALVRLKQPASIETLGRRSFGEVCAHELGMSASVAEQLASIVGAFDRETAISLQQDRASALVDLSRALPAHPAPATLVGKRVRLPDGSRVDTKSASATSLHVAAKKARASTGLSTRGRTTTPDERGIATAAQLRLREAGFTYATVEAVATKPGQPSDVRILHVPIADLRKVAKILGR